MFLIKSLWIDERFRSKVAYDFNFFLDTTASPLLLYFDFAKDINFETGSLLKSINMTRNRNWISSKHARVAYTWWRFQTELKFKNK